VSESGGVHLARTDENVAEIAALAARLGGTHALSALRQDLDRRLRRTLAPGRAVHRAWTWDATDRRDPRWWPQGVAVLADGLLAVSWYAAKHGTRVSVLDLERRRYRHVLLVEPTADGGVRPLVVHAGGLAAHGRHLHVAATRAGVHVCSLDDLLRVPRAGLLDTLGYRWVLPVRFTYRATGGTFRYSFVATTEDGLVAGEYGSSSQSRRLARFAVDPETSLLSGEGTAEVVDSEISRAQGAVRAGGRWYVTSSHGPLVPGSVHVGGPGSFRRYRWATPPGPEDLAVDGDLLWSVTEHPRRRWVFSMRRSWFDRR
jgi:hypothetical protein